MRLSAGFFFKLQVFSNDMSMRHERLKNILKEEKRNGAQRIDTLLHVYFIKYAFRVRRAVFIRRYKLKIPSCFSCHIGYI